MKRTNPARAGSALVWTLLVITILSLVAAELLQVISGKYNSTLHTAVWQEALVAAESGVDLAIIELRKSLYPSPNGAWTGWTTDPGADAATHGLVTIPNAGLAGTPMTIAVSVDAPLQLKDPGNSWRYYRIRTTGSMPIPGPSRASDNKQDTRLRKLSLRFDRFTAGAEAIDASRVTRRIETIVRPVSAFDQAIISIGSLSLNNHNIEIDSYDSRDSNKSTNGLYDEDKRQENGNIATNGNLIDAGNAHIYGDVATNSGTVSGAANITGTERTDFYQEPIPVAAPAWPSINATPALVTNTATLTASATQNSAASRYVLSSIVISGGQRLTIAGNPDGSRTYIEIHVTGNISVGGNSDIILQPGVQATVYFAGNVDVQGKGIINSKNQPGDLLLYGIQPSDGTSRHVGLGGNGQISAAVYAPGHNVTINGGGTDGHVFGSVVGKTVWMTGVTDLHYDEALSNGGMINSYKIVSWFEDTR